MEAAKSVLRAVHERYGGRATREQIAAELRASTNSGAFRQKLAAAWLFGFVTLDREAVEATELGAMLHDEPRAPQARADGFLNVPLYAALYRDRFRTRPLPSDKGLEDVTGS